MNLLPMSYFIEVVNQQGISKAAEKLQITQQTLSSHIAALEKELGCSLFIRKPKFRLNCSIITTACWKAALTATII